MKDVHCENAPVSRSHTQQHADTTHVQRGAASTGTTHTLSDGKLGTLKFPRSCRLLQTRTATSPYRPVSGLRIRMQPSRSGRLVSCCPATPSLLAQASTHMHNLVSLLLSPCPHRTLNRLPPPISHAAGTRIEHGSSDSPLHCALQPPENTPSVLVTAQAPGRRAYAGRF
jgi:hypothetical protein